MPLTMFEWAGDDGAIWLEGGPCFACFLLPLLCCHCIAKMRVCGHCTIVKLGDQPNQEKTSDDTGTMEAPDQSSQQILVDWGHLFLFQAQA